MDNNASKQLDVVETPEATVYKDLLLAIKNSQHNLDMLTRISQHPGQPATYDSVPPPAKSILNKKITLTWFGPIESIANVLSVDVQYKVSVTGKPPVQPVMINVDAVDQPVYKIIESIGWQAGDNVTLIRDDVQREIKIIYEGS